MPHRRRATPGVRPGASASRSFDVAAFARARRGREEDWRFTPLHAAARPARRRRPSTGRHASRCSRAPPGRHGRDGAPRRRAARQRRRARRPASRARAWSVVRPAPRWSPSRATPSVAEPVVVAVTGAGAARRGLRAPAGRRRAARRGHRRARPRRQRRRSPTTSRSSSATAPSSPWSRSQDWADDAVHVARTTGPARPRRPAAAHRRSPSAATSCGIAPDGRVRRPRRRRRAARRSTSPTPASTSSTGCSSTTPRRNCRSNVRLQGRAAGRGRAHRLDRRRADPRRRPTGTDTYEINRNLVLTDGARADSVPEPGDRDRRDRRRRARQRHRPLRRRAAVLPAVPRHPRGRGPPPGRARLLRRPDRHASASPTLEERLHGRRRGRARRTVAASERR